MLPDLRILFHSSGYVIIAVYFLTTTPIELQWVRARMIVPPWCSKPSRCLGYRELGMQIQNLILWRTIKQENGEMNNFWNNSPHPFTTVVFYSVGILADS
jgi:hypothetical protein